MTGLRSLIKHPLRPITRAIVRSLTKDPSGPFDLATLFDNGESGFLLSDLPYFVDVDGNTPATWGDPVGRINDSSGNGNDFTQPTVTARPILGRVPRGGRRNESLVSEGFNWSTNNSAVRTNDGENPYGVTPSARVVTAENTGSSGVYRQNLLGRALPAGTEITVSIRLKPISMTSPLRAALEGTAFSGVPVANIDLGSHTVNPLNSFASWRMSEGEDGFFVVEATTTTPADGTVNISFYNQDANTGSNEFLITALQVEFSETASPYQSVLSAYDITESGVPEIHYLDFDGTDDLISTELPAIDNGTLVIAGTNGIWIDDDYNFDGGTFSIGPTSYPGGPEGILTAIGEPIVGGFLVINRQLSQLERELVIQELKERGAPGVFELGPEIFDPNLWEVRPSDSGVTFTESSPNEYAIVTIQPNSGIAFPLGEKFTEGSRVLLSYEFRNESSDGVQRLSTSGAPTSWNTTTEYRKETYALTITSVNSLLQFRSGALYGGTVYAKNVSLRKLELIP